VSEYGITQNRIAVSFFLMGLNSLDTEKSRETKGEVNITKGLQTLSLKLSNYETLRFCSIYNLLALNIRTRQIIIKFT